MTVFCAILVLVYLLYSIYKTFSWICVLKWIEKNEKSKRQQIHYDYLPYFIILIPALREASLVDETMEYFTKLAYPKDKLFIVFVTTEDEKIFKRMRRTNIEKFFKHVKNNYTVRTIASHNSGLFPRSYFKKIIDIMDRSKDNETRLEKLFDLYDSVPDTGDLIANKIKSDKGKYKNYYHISCPCLKGGGKPTQLNYAVEYLNEIIDFSKINKDHLYIGVYDFDSRPDIRTLNYIAAVNYERIQNNQKTPDFYQQTQLPLNNLEYIDQFSKFGSLIKSNLNLYTRRALGIELYKLKKMEIFQRKIRHPFLHFLQPAINAIGTGMFIKPETLNEIDGFAEPVEDLVLGYKLGILGKEVVPIPYLNIMEPYYNIISMINSHSRIFMIALRLYKEKIKINSFISGVLAIKEFFECIIWLLCTPILWAGYVYLLLNTDPLLVGCLLFITVFMRFYLEEILLIKVNKKLLSYHQHNSSLMVLKPDEIVRMVLLSPILGLIRFITALIGLCKLIYIYVLKKKTIRAKTER